MQRQLALRSRSAAGASILVFCLLACARQQQGAVTTTIDTVNGAVRVRNAGVPARWELRELVTLGAGTEIESNTQQEFARIAGVIADARNNIYVADGNEIRVFDDQGQLVRRIGREGGGPAEFRSLQSIGWLGDTLLTMDWRNVRIGLLSPTGQWLGQRNFPAISGGRIRFHQTGPAELYSAALLRAGGRSQFAFVRQMLSGEADTLAVPPNPDAASGRTVACDIQNGITFFTPAFAPNFVTQPGPNATLINYWNGDYRLHHIRGQDTVRIIERDLPRRPVTDEDWSHELERFRAWRDSLPAGRVCQPGEPERPEARELLREIFFDDQSRMWLERSNGSGFAFDVFDASGHLLAELAAPERSPRIPVFVRGDRLYLVATDSLDIPLVKVFQILRGGK